MSLIENFAKSFNCLRFSTFVSVRVLAIINMSHGGLSGKVIQIQFYRTVLTGLIYVVTDSVGRLTSYMTMIITTFLSTLNSMINRSVNVMA